MDKKVTVNLYGIRNVVKHPNGCVFSYDLTATAPEFFFAELLNQVFEAGVKQGKNDKASEISAALMQGYQP